MRAISSAAILLLIIGLLAFVAKAAYIHLVYEPEQRAVMAACKARGVGWHITYEDTARWYARDPWERIACDDEKS